MKTVFKTHAEIAREFIIGTFATNLIMNFKRSANASTDGRVFVSYSTTVAKKHGAAKPGAMIDCDCVLIDSFRYSNTTAKQTGEIEGVCSRWGVPVIHVDNIDPKTEKDHENNRAELQARIIKAVTKMNRARTDSSRAYWGYLWKRDCYELAYYKHFLQGARLDTALLDAKCKIGR